MPDAASDLYHLFGFAFTNISPSLLTRDFQLSYCTYAFYCWVVDSRYAQKKRADKLFVIVCKLFFNGTRDREVLRIITMEGHLGTNEAKQPLGTVGFTGDGFHRKPPIKESIH